MKKKLNTLVIFLFVLGAKYSYSQEYTLSPDILAAFVTPINTTTAIQNADDVKISLSKREKENQPYEITLKYDSQEESFIIQPLTYPTFVSNFKRSMKRVLEKAKGVDNVKNSYNVKPVNHLDILDKEDEIASLFATIVTSFNTDEERPQIATISIKDKIKVYGGDLLVQELQDAAAEITFYDGFIEKIQIKGVIKDEDVVFSNKYSIGISSTKNIKNLYKNKLYSEETFTERILINNTINVKEVINTLPPNKINDPNELDKELKKVFTKLYINEFWNSTNDEIQVLIADLKTNFEKTKKNNFSSTLAQLHTEIEEIYDNRKKKRSIALTVNLSDVIRYVRKIDVNANDVSPEKQLVLLDRESRSSAKLYKEESTRIFETVVYTDFLSLVDEENPNGLVQTEVNKRFNINTSRYDVSKKGKYFYLYPILPLMISDAYGFFQFFDGQFQLSKIENNNRFLIPETITSNGVVSEQFYSPISLLQYRNFSLGGMLNIVNLENQNTKLNMYLNGGFHFGLSAYKPIENTTDEEDGELLSNIELPIEYVFHILPEERFSILLSDRLSYFENLSSDILLRSIEDQSVTSQNRWLNSFNFSMNLDISTTGKLFLRYKLVHELDNINNNFSQLQFGYSFYFLKNNKPVK